MRASSVSIVIPVLNGEETIGDMLAALLGQAGVPGEKEILVVDNGSRDRTREIVSKFPVTLLDAPTPGVSAARNRGLRAARGDIYVNIDADTLPSRYWLREILAPFSDETAVLVGGRILSYKPETGAERYIEASGLYAPEHNVANPHMPFAVGMNLAVRREAALAVGGWAEELTQGDDVDFSHRILLRFGGGVRYQPGAILFHRNRCTDAGLKKQARGYGYGSALLYRRYPDRFRWDFSAQLRVASLLLNRFFSHAATAVGSFLGRVPADRAEFARYHRMWAFSYWQGFLETYYTARRRGIRLWR